MPPPCAKSTFAIAPLAIETNAVSATQVFQAEDGLTSGDGVSVFWKSVCRDVFLITDKGPVDEEPVPFVSLEELNIEFIGDPDEWTLELVGENGRCLAKEHAIKFQEEMMLGQFSMAIQYFLLKKLNFMGNRYLLLQQHQQN